MKGQSGAGEPGTVQCSTQLHRMERVLKTEKLQGTPSGPQAAAEKVPTRAGPEMLALYHAHKHGVVTYVWMVQVHRHPTASTRTGMSGCCLHCTSHVFGPQGRLQSTGHLLMVILANTRSELPRVA